MQSYGKEKLTDKTCIERGLYFLKKGGFVLQNYGILWVVGERGSGRGTTPKETSKDPKSNWKHEGKLEIEGKQGHLIGRSEETFKKYP